MRIARSVSLAAPIFVNEDVVQRAQKVEVAAEESSAGGEDTPKVEEEAKVKEWLDSIKPGDFMERGKDPGKPE